MTDRHGQLFHDRMVGLLINLLELDIPSQFVPLAAFPPVGLACADLGLPGPVLVAGNIVVGDLGSARYVLSAHLDQASFQVISAEQNLVRLAACHRYAGAEGPVVVRFTGVRHRAVVRLGERELVAADGGFSCDLSGILLGDRAVYRQDLSVRGTAVSASAIDDRAGAVIALTAASVLRTRGLPVAVVLSDGEQNLPTGYFSRTFPQILGRLAPVGTIVFVDGIFDGLKREGRTGPEPGALIVPHTADGAGYTVPPALFARLRDEIVPAATARGIDVRISAAYHSRGDDWGLVTNPVSGGDHDAFFVSFGGGGSSPARRTLDTRCLDACLDFLIEAITRLAGTARDLDE
jgi:hypothetical protein